MVKTKFLIKYWYALSILLLLVIAACLRLYKLGEVPHGMAWDEAAIGYNGFAVLTTRRDEWLVHFPVSFKSFGDYKAPLAIYINGFFTLLFGMNLWAVRLPFALFGIAGVAGFIFLTREICATIMDEETAQKWAIFAGIFITFSPWHIHFSRIAFETGIALTLLVWGFFFLLRFLLGKKSGTSNRVLVLSVLLCCASMYTYHSAKIVAPVMVLVFCLFFFRQSWSHRKELLLGGVGALLVLLPMLKNIASDGGNTRFDEVSIFRTSSSFSLISQQLWTHTLAQFSPSYLFLGATPTLRHGDGRWGVLFPTTFVLVCLGVIFFVMSLIWRKKKLITGNRLRLYALSIVWIIIGNIPAIIGQTVPHANRAFLSLPGFLLLAVLAFQDLLILLERSKLNKVVSGSKGEENLLVKSVLGMFFVLHGFCAMSYLHNYYTTYAANSASAFQDGYLEAFQELEKYASSFSKVLITTKYGEPYIYLLFTLKMDPITYQSGGLAKYEFTDSINPLDQPRTDEIGIADPTQLNPITGDKVIYGSDGKPAFILFNIPKTQ